MPQIYFLDNYCYELTNICFSVYKYDIFEHNYYKVDQFLITKVPLKYQHIVKNIQEYGESLCDKDILDKIKDIKVSA